MTPADTRTARLTAPLSLPPLVARQLSGEELDLLQPLRFLMPGDLPSGQPPTVDRRELARALAAANSSYGHPRADELAAKLADPATRVVITGQQPGLFGGPLYALSKAIAAARWAAALEERGESAVAVYWVATEDHDFAEVASAWVPTPDGPHRFELGADPEPLVPLGGRSLGDAVEAALEAIRALPGAPGQVEIWNEIARWYRPSARFGEAFARLFVRALGSRCPLLLDSQLPQLKAAQRPWLARFIGGRHELESRYADRDSLLASRGFAPQVAPQRGASPLFLLDAGRRRRIEWRGEAHWSLRGSDAEPRPVAELLARLEDNPLTFSPGVLARPAIQDAVLGTTLQVMGPAEMTYLTQVAPAYRLFDIPAPWTTLRPQVALLERRHRQWMEDLGLDLPTVLGDRGSLERALAARRGADPSQPLAERLTVDLEVLRQAAVAIDPNLESPWQKTRDQILRGLETFSSKLTAAAARADETALRRVDQLRDHVLPAGRPQERTYCVGAFLARYGAALAETLWQQMDLDPRQLQGLEI